MNRLTSMKPSQVSDLDINQNILDSYFAERQMDKLAHEIRQDIQSLKYLDQCINNFFVMKDVLYADTELQKISNSSEAITTMSKKAQGTMAKMTDYMGTFFKWTDSVLLVSLKNTLRITTALTKILRASPEKKDQLVKVYDTKDVQVQDYILFIRNVNKMNSEIVDNVEKLRNITGDDSITESSAVKEQVANDTAKYDEAITAFINTRNDEEKKLTPEDGHWTQDSYIQQLDGAIQEAIAALQKIKRMKSTLQQIVNNMKTLVDTNARKTNNIKLDTLKELFLNKIKTNLGHLSTIIIYVGKKTQVMLKAME